MSEGPPTSGSGAEPAQPAVPPGWYPHPTAPGWEAYWTGSGWGTETRQAQAAPAAPEVPAEPQAQTTEVQPAAGTAAAAAGAGQAAQAQPAQQDVTQTPAQEAYPHGTADPGIWDQGSGTAATGAGAPLGAATPVRERSNSPLPAILCVLGAIVAIVGSFLPLASSSFDGIDFADNTMIGQSLGLAVIAVAAIGAVLAVFSYLRGNRTWLVVLAGVVVIAIAAYAGLVVIDDLSPAIADPTGSGGGEVKISGDLSEAINPDSSPSTGVFAVAVGGLLMVLGGVGLARENR